MMLPCLLFPWLILVLVLPPNAMSRLLIAIACLAGVTSMLGVYAGFSDGKVRKYKLLAQESAHLALFLPILALLFHGVAV